MILDCLFLFIGILFKFNYKYSIYLFVLFLIVFYKKYNIKDFRFILIQIITVFILFLMAFNNVIVNILYEYCNNGKLIFRYENYLYNFSIYFVSISLFYLYLYKKRYENYILILPFLVLDYRIVIAMLVVLLFKIDYKKLIKHLKENFLFITAVTMGLYFFSFLDFEFINKIFITKFYLYILLFIIVNLVLVYKNFQITKIINFLILELILVYPIYFDVVFYIVMIILFLILYKFYNKGLNYLKSLNTPIFIVLTLIGIILIISYYMHIPKVVNSKNTFLYTSFLTPLKAYEYYFFYLIFFVAFLLEAKKVIYKKMINVFILSIFVSEIFSYMIIFDLKPILNIFLDRYHICDPAPFTNHILYSFFISLMLIFLIDTFLKSNNKYKYFLLLFIVTATLNLFLNGGRIGQLSFILGVLIYFWFYFENIKKFFIFMIIFFSVIFLIFEIPTKCNNNKRLHKGVNSFNKVIHKNNYISSWGVRLGADIITIKYMLHNPKYLLFGIGAEGDKEELFTFATNNDKNIAKSLYHYNLSHLHNTFMQLLLNVGIIPFLLFLYIFYYLAKLKTSNEALKYSLLAVIFVFVNQGVVLFYPQEFMSFLFVIIVIWNLRRKNDICINSHIQ